MSFVHKRNITQSTNQIRYTISSIWLFIFKLSFSLQIVLFILLLEFLSPIVIIWTLAHTNTPSKARIKFLTQINLLYLLKSSLLVFLNQLISLISLHNIFSPIRPFVSIFLWFFLRMTILVVIILTLMKINPIRVNIFPTKCQTTFLRIDRVRFISVPIWTKCLVLENGFLSLLFWK